MTDDSSLPVFRGRDHAEMFVLQEDPGETRNRWADREHAGQQSAMMLRFLKAKMERESTRSDRIAARSG